MAGMSSLVRIVNAGVPGSQDRVDVVLRDGVVASVGLRVKMCVWLGVSRGLDLAFLNAD